MKELEVGKGNHDGGRFDRIGMDSTALRIHRVLKDFSRDPLAWSNKVSPCMVLDDGYRREFWVWLVIQLTENLHP